MWEYVPGGATVFGPIVTLGAWINGRMTRKVMVEYFKKSDERFQELLKQMDEHFRKIDKRFQELIGQHNELIKQHQELVKQHRNFKENSRLSFKDEALLYY